MTEVPSNAMTETDLSTLEADQVQRIVETCQASCATPRERWVKALKLGRSASLSAAALRAMHRYCWEETSSTTPIWFPDLLPEVSNVASWCEHRQLDDFDSFYRWSVDQREAFWSEAVDRLGIRFSHRSGAVLDLGQGIARAAWFPDSKLNIVNSCFAAAPDQVALIAQRAGGPMRKWTYQQLKQNACQVANGLVDAGYRVGDAIGIFMPMTDWSVAIYLGIVMAGCHVVSIADSFAPPEIATRLRISNAKAIFTYDVQTRGGKKLDLLRRLKDATDVPAIVLPYFETLEVDLRDQDSAWEEFLPASRMEFEPVIGMAQETINVLFSSGTTGDPKAIPWNHLTPIKCALDGYCHQNIQPGDVCCWPTNLGWMMGPWLIFASMINRATIALYEDAPVGTGFGKFVQDSKVTMLGVVPTLVKAWQASGEMEAFDWSRIKVFSSTGESSQVGPMTYLSSLAGFQPVIEYCGGTEIGGGYVSSVVDRPNFPAAFNTAAVGIDFLLMQPDAKDAPILSDEGEVLLVPPSIGLSNRLINRDHFETYYHNVPRLEGYEQLRRHGDHFRKQETDYGCLYVAGGRVDDTMNLGGIKTSSAEIERVLNRCPEIMETAAVAYASEDRPDQLIVFAVLQSGPNNDLDESLLTKAMNTRLKTELNPLFRVSELRIVDALPRTASGKVMRRKLRATLD